MSRKCTVCFNCSSFLRVSLVLRVFRLFKYLACFKFVKCFKFFKCLKCFKCFKFWTKSHQTDIRRSSGACAVADHAIRLHARLGFETRLVIGRHLTAICPTQLQEDHRQGLNVALERGGKAICPTHLKQAQSVAGRPGWRVECCPCLPLERGKAYVQQLTVIVEGNLCLGKRSLWPQSEKRAFSASSAAL